MATKKIRMRSPESSYVDILHPETEASMVVMDDGSTLSDTNKFSKRMPDNWKAPTDSPSTYPVGETIFMDLTNAWGSSCGVSYATIKTIKGYGQTCTQIAYPYVDVQGALIKLRHGNFNSNTWSDWFIQPIIVRGTGTIQTTGWVSGSGATNYPYYKLVYLPGVAAVDKVDICINIAHMYRAEECGLAPANDAGTDSIAVYAKSIPTQDIPFEFVITKG